jgi:hypothetical protein
LLTCRVVGDVLPHRKEVEVVHVFVEAREAALHVDVRGRSGRNVIWVPFIEAVAHRIVMLLDCVLLIGVCILESKSPVLGRVST